MKQVAMAAAVWAQSAQRASVESNRRRIQVNPTLLSDSRLCKSAPAKLSILWPPSWRYCHIPHDITAVESYSVYVINPILTLLMS
jgi:hypothetical protein